MIITYRNLQFINHCNTNHCKEFRCLNMYLKHNGHKMQDLRLFSNKLKLFLPINQRTYPTSGIYSNVCMSIFIHLQCKSLIYLSSLSSLILNFSRSGTILDIDTKFPVCSRETISVNGNTLTGSTTISTNALLKISCIPTTLPPAQLWRSSTSWRWLTSNDNIFKNWRFSGTLIKKQTNIVTWYHVSNRIYEVRN